MVSDIQTGHRIIKSTEIQNVNKPFVQGAVTRAFFTRKLTLEKRLLVLRMTMAHDTFYTQLAR